MKHLFLTLSLVSTAIMAEPKPKTEKPVFRVSCTESGQVAFVGDAEISFPSKGGVRIKAKNGNEYTLRSFERCVVEGRAK